MIVDIVFYLIYHDLYAKGGWGTLTKDANWIVSYFYSQWDQ